MPRADRLLAIARALAVHGEVFADEPGATAAWTRFVVRARRLLELAGELVDGAYRGPSRAQLGELPPPLRDVLAALRAARPPTAQELLAVRPWISAGPDPERSAAISVAVIGVLREREVAVRSVLDLGCGPGIIAGEILAALPDVKVTLVDRAPVLEQAARLLRYVRGRIELAVADLAAPKLALPVVPHDAILLADVLHTLPQAAAAQLLGEARRYATEHGVLIIAELSDSSIEGAFYALVAALLQADFDLPSREQRRQWIAAAGFDDVEQRSAPLVDVTIARVRATSARGAYSHFVD